MVYCGFLATLGSILGGSETGCFCLHEITSCTSVLSFTDQFKKLTGTEQPYFTLRLKVKLVQVLRVKVLGRPSLELLEGSIVCVVVPQHQRVCRFVELYKCHRD